MSETPLTEKPHRHIEFVAKISADSWKDLQHELHHLATEIARHDCLPAQSCSGGYSTGHIFVTSVDHSMDHDKWFAELTEYLDNLEKKKTEPTP